MRIGRNDVEMFLRFLIVLIFGFSLGVAVWSAVERKVPQEVRERPLSLAYPPPAPIVPAVSEPASTVEAHENTPPTKIAHETPELCGELCGRVVHRKKAPRRTYMRWRWVDEDD